MNYALPTMSKKQESKLSSLSYYHPIRYAIARNSFINEAIKSLPVSFNLDGDFIFNYSIAKYKDSYSRFVNGRNSHILSSLAQDLYPTAIRRLYAAINRMSSEGKHQDREALLKLLSTANDNDYTVFKQYALLICQNNIFDFDSKLLKFFESTDVDHVLLKDINLPFPTTYLHFGKQCDKKIHGNISTLINAFVNKRSIPGFKIDIDFFLNGAYVSQCPNTGKLVITLISAIGNNRYMNNCIDCYEDTFQFSLIKTSEHTTIREAVELEKEKIFAFNKEQLFQENAKYWFKDSLDNELERIKLVIDKRINSVSKYLNLVINCILYLQSYPEEIEENYLSENRAVTKTKGFGKAADRKEPSNSQYRKIKFCGRKRKYKPIEEETIGEEINLLGADLSDEEKRSVSSHKRRAHRRKQRYGKNLEQWRYVWIKETTIHKEKYQNYCDNYRIYEVETPSKNNSID